MSFPIDQCGNNSCILYFKDKLFVGNIQIFCDIFCHYFNNMHSTMMLICDGSLLSFGKEFFDLLVCYFVVGKVTCKILIISAHVYQSVTGKIEEDYPLFALFFSL